MIGRQLTKAPGRLWRNFSWQRSCHVVRSDIKALLASSIRTMISLDCQRLHHRLPIEDFDPAIMLDSTTTLSSWHCHKGCQFNQHCTRFTWDLESEFISNHHNKQLIVDIFPLSRPRLHSGGSRCWNPWERGNCS